MLFKVIDKQTGKVPDLEKIALEEQWARDAGLVYCDMEGFTIDEDGCLTLQDQCGNCCSVPPDRFEVVWGLAQWQRDELARRLRAIRQSRDNLIVSNVKEIIALAFMCHTSAHAIIDTIHGSRDGRVRALFPRHNFHPITSDAFGTSECMTDGEGHT